MPKLGIMPWKVRRGDVVEVIVEAFVKFNSEITLLNCNPK
jgi:formate-dependent phosphoribosylglycinamide formyltransferase (GAR transformylase)